VPNFGQADGIHNAPFVLHDVDGAQMIGKRVTMSVHLHNIGTQGVKLQAVSAQGTVRQTLYPAPVVAAGARKTVNLDMQFYRDVPQAFSLVLDFGLDGTNTTLVRVSK